MGEHQLQVLVLLALQLASVTRAEGKLLQTEEKNVLLTNSEAADDSEAQQNLDQPDGKETQTGRASANRYTLLNFQNKTKWIVH